jgi:hypothetical protein
MARALLTVGSIMADIWHGKDFCGARGSPACSKIVTTGTSRQFHRPVEDHLGHINTSGDRSRIDSLTLSNLTLDDN